MGKPKKSKTTNTELSDTSKQINKRKTRSNNDITVEPKTNDVIVTTATPTTEEKVKNKTRSLKNTKIIFTDDNGSEENTVESEMKTKKNKQMFQGEEAEVKDEDIDKFCDELDEEDNVQFDDWVKQIEEKLHSNKKKS